MVRSVSSFLVGVKPVGDDVIGVAGFDESEEGGDFVGSDFVFCALCQGGKGMFFEDMFFKV